MNLTKKSHGYELQKLIEAIRKWIIDNLDKEGCAIAENRVSSHTTN